MNSDDAAVEPSERSILPEPVAAHELAFGRESTSGYLLEQEARHVAPVEACAERLQASLPPQTALEQDKPPHSIRI